MTTNDEIREQENRQMAHYKSLTPDEQADRERSLMNKARADERSKVLEECGKHAEIILKYEADGNLLLCETCDDDFEKYKSYWDNEAEIQKCIKQQAQWERRQDYLVKFRNKLIADWLLKSSD